MTNEQEIVSFQKKLEERNFVFDDRLLEQLVESKLAKLHKQFEDNKELRRIIKRQR
jgi:hypothetical protein